VGSGTEGAVVDRQLALTDLDGDDDPDIATVGGETVGVLENMTGRPAH
jgi:hypothetical protein